MAIIDRASELKLVREVDGLEIAVEALQGMWTIDQYVKLTDQTNHLVEYNYGVIEVLQMPTRRHQVILALLYELFAGVIRARGGTTLFAPLRLQIDPVDFVSRICSLYSIETMSVTKRHSGWAPMWCSKSSALTTPTAIWSPNAPNTH